MSKLSKKRNTKNYRLFVIYASIFSGIIIIYYSIKANYYNNNKTKSKAIITNIKHSHYFVPDFESTKINNYLITYKYIISNKTYKRSQEILTSELKNFFNHEPRKGDTINISYSIANPLISNIEKNN